MNKNINMNKNKMYINPNFKKVQTPMKPLIHVDPNFYSHLLQNNMNATVNVRNPKIYINPRFVQQQQPGLELSQATEIQTNKYEVPISFAHGILNEAQTKIDVNRPMLPTSKSRYKLVRNSVNNQIKKSPAIKKKTTVVINKYKIASMTIVKKNIEIADYNRNVSSTVNILNSQQNTKKPNNKYKLIRSVNLPVLQNAAEDKVNNQARNKNYIESKDKLKLVSIENCIKLRRKLNSRVVLKQKHLLKTQNERIGKLKKNNIPCPLFRKFGKCIRTEQGKCKYAHDKKHVSICRKFIQGLCNDDNCLLSHDLTSNKMPTCRFYLKGLCTKENCPYIHVKLSEKTTICLDFLKGYCEKGDECLKRHIYICPRYTVTGKCCMPKCPYPHKATKSKIARQNKKDVVVQLVEQKPVEVSSKGDEISREEIKDQRYYVDEAQAEPESEILRPTRCKLGILPSYIKF